MCVDADRVVSQDAYLAIVEAFAHFRGPKLFLSYNDLVDSPVDSVKQLSHFLRGQGITVPSASQCDPGWSAIASGDW